MGVAEEIRQKLLPRFREMTADRVERISSVLLELERGTAGEEARADLARELHTLKGEARMMGFVGLSSLVHAAEDLLKAGGAQPSPAVLQALLEACDLLVPLTEGPPDGGAVAAQRTGQLQSLLFLFGAGAAPGSELGAGSGSGPVGSPGSETTATGPASTTPLPAAAPAALPGPKPDPAERLQLRGDRPAASIRIDVDRLDEIAALTGDVLVEGARAMRRSRALTALLGRWSRLSDRVVALSEQLRQAGLGGRQVEVLEGDIHLLRSDTFRFVRHHTEAVQGALTQFSRLAERVGSARLIPLSGVLAGFPRAARDMANELGKAVDCSVKGGQTGVDKAILVALNDPLVHLVRNAVDHGLEPPEEREAAGKPRVGRLTISARTDGDLLALVVEDDGRGIDADRVRAAALRKGLLGEAQAAALSDPAAVDLVFAPGFTTRDSAGELSGRGVGLDVVRKHVVALGGSVTVETVAGRSTRFTLRLPQSLSLMKVLLVRLDDDVYGLPALDVDSVDRLDPRSVSEVAGIRAARHRGRLLPLVALGPLLSLNGGPRHPRPTVVHLRHGSEGAAVVVDGLVGEREVAVKAPGAFLKGMRFVTGAAALDDGRVALLLSSADIVGAARRLAPPAVGEGRERRRLRLLLVDDSAIAREAEATLLRSLGHEVEEAEDGELAWRRLQSGAFQLLVTDVQMPVLDGIDLTRRVRATPRFHKLPVVILSSLSAPEERRRGVDAGADAYLVKGELDPQALSAMLDRLCGAGAGDR